MRAKRRSISERLNSQDCSGCGVCVLVCRAGALSMQSDREGFVRPVIDASKCVECGKCLKSCSISPSFTPDRSCAGRYYVGRVRDGEVLERSSSGGIAFAAGKYIIERRGGVCAGVRLTAVRAEFSLAADCGALREHAASKYTQAVAAEVFPRIKELLKSGRPVFFSGTPCMVSALYSFLGDDDENLLTADLFCHGAPSPGVFAGYCDWLEKRYRSRISGIRFRDKSISGWSPSRLTVDFESGERYTELCSKDPYYQLFLSSMILRPNCYRCVFTRPDRRIADISLGDAWSFPERAGKWNDNRGLSAIIVNSDKGAGLLAALRGQIELEETSLQQIDQRALHAPAEYHPDRDDFFRTLRKRGLERATAVYSVPRPLFRRLRSRLRRICARLFSMAGSR